MGHQIIYPFDPLDINEVMEVFKQASIPFCACIILKIAGNTIHANGKRLWSYFLFFSISLTSLLGTTQTLTGSHAESTNWLFYGLSFYSASLAFHFAQAAPGHQVKWPMTIFAANPLLIFTGPIATQFGPIRHKCWNRRVRYFFPFVVIGLFFHQTIATPLVETFHLIKNTDLVSSLTFALIFELFVYANFCGLSLLIYGLFGVAGYKIPLNFRQPFSASNLIDFWRGWHTSLSSVLKILFYVPARKAWNTESAIIIVYFASAMWHGVTWNFVIWGLMHGCFFVIGLHLLRRKIRFLSVPLMVTGIILGRLVFADANFDRLSEKLSFRYRGLEVFGVIADLTTRCQLSLLIILGIVGSEFFFQRHPCFRKRNYKFLRLPMVQIILMILLALTLSRSANPDFAVYGQR